MNDLAQGLYLSIIPIFIGVMLFVFWGWGSKIENSIAPAVSKMSIVKISEDDLSTTYEAFIVKNRGCKPVLDKFAWYTIDEYGIKSRANFEFINEAVGSKNRPVGINDLGLWKVENKGRNIVSQELIIVHNCHFLWNINNIQQIKEFETEELAIEYYQEK